MLFNRVLVPKGFFDHPEKKSRKSTHSQAPREMLSSATVVLNHDIKTSAEKGEEEDFLDRISSVHQQRKSTNMSQSKPLIHKDASF